MGVLDKIKNFFQRRNNKALPEGNFENYNEDRNYYENGNSNNNSYDVTLTRNDGTKFNIMPILDDCGNPAYEQVYNDRTHQFQAIPKYNVQMPGLKLNRL